MRQAEFSHHSLLITRYLPLLWLLALAAYILAGTPTTPFHGDESTQIYMSRDYAYQFMQRDFTRLAYRDPPSVDQEQHLRLLNGTLNKYLIGLAWHLSGFSPENLNQQWDWGADWDYNQQNNHAPSAALLQISRWPSSILLAAGVVLMFALGYVLGGYPTAYLASLYYALCPPLLLNGHRAMMEGSLTFFSLLTVLAGVWFARKPSWSASLALGLAAGLALASKHSALFAIASVFISCLFFLPGKVEIGYLSPFIPELERNWRAEYTRQMWQSRLNAPEERGRVDDNRYFINLIKDTSLFWWIKLLFAGIIALLIFYALNPAWWGDPITRAQQVLDLREDLLAIQTSVFGGYANPLDALAGFLRQVFIAHPQYFEVAGWDAYIGDQIAHAESSPWRGVSIGGSPSGAVLLLAMLIIGLWALFRRLNNPTHRVIGVWALAVMLATLLLTPIEWQRYYVPAYPAVGLLAALGITHALRWIKGINHKAL